MEHTWRGVPVVVVGKTLHRVWEGLDGAELFVLCTDGTLYCVRMADQGTLSMTEVRGEEEVCHEPKPPAA